MRSSGSTSSALALALAAAALGVGGCGGGPDARDRDPAKVEADARAAEEGRERLCSLLPGRWTGGPVAPPEGVWFERAKFDVVFGFGGDFTAVASTFARRPYDLRFEGEFEVLDGDQVRVEAENLRGVWKVERADARELVLANDDMKLALTRRYGS